VAVNPKMQGSKMKQPQITEANEGRIRLKDLLNEGMESSGEHLADIALKNEDEVMVTYHPAPEAIEIQPAANNDEVIANIVVEVIEELPAEVVSSEEQVPVVLIAEPTDAKITPVKEWLNKEKEKAAAAEEIKTEVAFQEVSTSAGSEVQEDTKNKLLENVKLEDKVYSDEEEAANNEPPMELVEELPAEIIIDQVEDVVGEENAGYKIEGSVKVSGETGKIIIEKMSEEEAAKIKATRKDPIEQKEIVKPKSVYDEIDFPKNKGFQRPQDVLKNWVRFSQLQIGTMDAMNQQLKKIATSDSGRASSVNEKLHILAEATKIQCAELDNIAGIAKSLNINNEDISLSDCLSAISKSIDDGAVNIRSISQKAFSIADEMADAQSNLSVMEAFIGRLQKITKQTNFLAINAAIEAARAGEMGGGFEAISDELRDLSKSVAKLSEEMHDKIGRVIKSASDSFVILNEFASMNVAESIVDKEKIEAVAAAVLKQNDKVEQLLHSNAAVSRKNLNSISIIADDMHASDDSKRQIEDVAGVLKVIMSNTYSHKMDALKSLGMEISNADVEKDVIEKMLSGITLEQLKKDFVNFLCAEGYIKA
jgi:methyl-accepting chemotaxis protein